MSHRLEFVRGGLGWHRDCLHKAAEERPFVNAEETHIDICNIHTYFIFHFIDINVPKKDAT
jgi:hypothetical protein